MKNYFFEDIDVLINHLYSINDNISPIKLQKSLYFLFAFYGATYGDMSQQDEGKTETTEEHPDYLFKDEFCAWKYGPVIKDVYSNHKQGNHYKAEAISDAAYNPDIILYLEELFEEISNTSDFALVERSHMDQAWRRAYKKSNGFEGSEMLHNDIVEEYRGRFV